MNRKILLALSIVLVAIAAVGTVSAFELPDLGSLFGGPADQHITIDGENFTIPGTLEENLDNSDNGTVTDYTFFTCTQYGKGYINGTDYINIMVNDYNITDLSDDLVNFMDGKAKEISGQKGFLYHDDVGYTYTFSKENKVIVIQSNDESLIAPVIA
mgnify:FL=1